MPDYAGAKAAIRSRFEAAWTQSRITYQNETPEQPWPPVNVDAELEPWVSLEIIGSGSRLVGTGQAGNLRWVYEGEVLVHVFVPIGTADTDATTLALAAGELFRAAKFYDDTPGFYVRTTTPSIDDGDSADDDGNWFRCSMSVDFTYYHRG